MARLFALLALFSAILTAALAAPAQAAYPARPAGAVLDEAGILAPAKEAAMDAKLRAYNARTGRAVVVATVNSLGGETIEIYSANLFAAWGIGGKDSDQGLLLLVAPNERQVRIEVGYGLTPYVTDILSGRIVRGDILPRFKAGDYAGGIDAGLDALIVQMDRTPADARAVAEAAAAAEQAGADQNGASIGGVIFWIALIIVFIGIFGRGAGGRRYRSRRGGVDPWVVMWGASEIARHASGRSGGSFGGGGFGGGGFGGFGGGMSGGGGASGSW